MSVAAVFDVLKRRDEIIGYGKGSVEFIQNNSPVSCRTAGELVVSLFALTVISWLGLHLDHKNSALGRLDAEKKALMAQLQEAESFRDKTLQRLNLPVWNATQFGRTAFEIEHAITNLKNKDSKFKKTIDKNYALINQESSKLWKKTSELIKSPLASEAFPILSLDPKNPSQSMMQINYLSHKAHGCYVMSSRLDQELCGWRGEMNKLIATNNSTQEYVRSLHAEMSEAKDKAAFHIEQLRAAENSWKDEKKALEQSCEAQKNDLKKICKNEKDKAIEALNKEKGKVIDAINKEKDGAITDKNLCDKNAKKNFDQERASNVALQEKLKRVEKDFEDYKNSWHFGWGHS